MATVVGLFSNLNVAQSAVDSLVKSGFKRYDISLMANATAKEYSGLFPTTSTVNNDSAVNAAATDSSAGIADQPLTTGEGAGVGVMAGAVTGLIVGLAAFMIPGVGPFLAAGPLLAALTGGAVGAVAGAATGGITAALIKSGVPEDEATAYAQGVERGGTLVMVRTTDDQIDAAKRILRSEQATSVVGQAGDQQTDATLVETNNRGTHIDYPIGSTTFSFFDADCQRDFASHYANTRYTYAQLRPFYEYGFNLASDPRYFSASWSEVEADATRYWSENNPNDNWNNYSEAVQFGWNCVRRSAAGIASSDKAAF